jgi:hypothetical protein
MPSNVLKFEFNKPETVELQSLQTLNVLGNYGAQTLYALMDGRRMYCDLKLDAQIKRLAPRPGESFMICKHKDSQDARVNRWTVWLTPESEKRRAAEEMPEIAAALVDPMPANVREMKIPAQAVNEPAALAPTGTDGPLPQPARKAAPQLAPARVPRGNGPIPFNVAFRETVQFVTAELKAAGEQWNDQAKQDMVSTVLISAAKSGLVGLWERGE